MKRTKVPVNLEVGDIFETVWGDIKIIDKDGREYQFQDIKTGEKAWVSHDGLVQIMVGSIIKS